MGCLSALKIWRKKAPAPKPVTHTKVILDTSRDSSRSTATYDEKFAPIATEVPGPLPIPPSARGVPIRPDVNPAYSAYSTPADPRWADSLTTNQVSSITPSEAARLKEEEAGDPEAARQRRAEEEKKRQAEREEQERLDFFQMIVPPPYTTEEKQWLKAHFKSEYKFLEQYGLSIHDEEEREEGRRIARALMANDG
ncbi:hypothetical protein B0T21DRAFT_408962 [Apiosordaria backusii]|uniref:Uncharacterized protein n=1 Tax=Apiosordaria backusii TaxID=314023 RepID=A0AA40EML0_9PEZI|nr:hypothetical protein B0T21DRAFT_408962 [Apiosordaria backusii]